MAARPAPRRSEPDRFSPLADPSSQTVSRRGSYSASAAFGLASFALLAVIGIGGGIVIARLYGIEIIGALALATVPAAVCGSLSSLQEQAALVREVVLLPPRHPRITGLFVAVLAFSAGLTVVVGLVVGGIATVVLQGPVDRPDLVAPALVLIAEYVVLSNTYWNADMIFAAFRAGQPLFWMRLQHAVIYLVIAILLAELGSADSVWGLVAAQIGAAVFSVLVRVVLLRRYMRFVVPRAVLRDGMRSFPDILRFGVKVAPAGIADGVSLETGTLILGVTASVPAVGAWSRSWQLARRLLDPTYRIAEMLFPTLVERRSSEDHAGFDRALLDSARLAGVALLVPAAAAGGAADGIMDLYGPGFDQAATALALLLLVPAAFCVMTLLGQALLAVDKPLTFSKLSAMRAALIVATGVPMTLWLGITGMALATLVAFGLNLVAVAVAARPHVRGDGLLLWPRKVLIGVLLAYVAGFAVARLVDAAVGGLGGLTLALLGGSAAFVAILTVGGGLTTEDRRRVGQLKARVRPASAGA